METKTATIKRDGENASLILHFGATELEIIMTDDNPNKIKSSFNSLISKLKEGLFEFNLDDDTEDLYKHICSEYLLQLNSEMKEVYKEFKDYNLLKE